MQYIQDYDERFPVWQHGSDRTTGWAVTLQPYLKSTQIFQCPSEKTAPDQNPSNVGYSDYFYNSNLGPRNGGRWNWQLGKAALTIISGDAASFSANNISNGGTMTATGKSAINGRQTGPAIAQGQWNPATNGLIHLDGANYGFADGHVKWMRSSKVTRNPVAKGDYTFRWSAKKQPDSGS
jgi:prepilin-type processing-associated H-X9-DG protein